jgi:hypothetical protein
MAAANRSVTVGWHHFARNTARQAPDRAGGSNDVVLGIGLVVFSISSRS